MPKGACPSQANQQSKNDLVFPTENISLELDCLHSHFGAMLWLYLRLYDSSVRVYRYAAEAVVAFPKSQCVGQKGTSCSLR